MGGLLTRSGRLSGGAGLAVSYGGGEPGLLERVAPLVDVLELTPDTMTRRGDEAALDRDAVAEVLALAGDAAIAVHGIGLSIGTADGWNETYLRLLDQLFAAVDVRWHSEHLGYTTVAGTSLGTMLTLPRTDEALDLVAGRIAALQARYGVPFLVENVADLLPDQGGPYSPARFLNELASGTGCGLLLDVHNLECDAWNHGLDVEAFLAELDLVHVREVHVAKGVEHRGLKLDVHSGRCDESTVHLARRVLAAAPSVAAVTFEYLPQAVPVLGEAGIAAELECLAHRLAAAEVPA